MRCGLLDDIQEFLNFMVQSLYKYCIFDLEDQRSEKQLSTPMLWFSSPESLNDPFECKPKFTFEGTAKEEVMLLVDYLRRTSQTKGLIDLFEEALDIQRGGYFSKMKEKFEKDILKKIEKEIGICCLSERNNSILMWSHYAKDHTGYCVEFEASETTPFFGAAQKVEYDHSYPMVDFFNTPHEKQVDLIFLTKGRFKFEAQRALKIDGTPLKVF